jgi:hypothetical protein
MRRILAILAFVLPVALPAAGQGLLGLGTQGIASATVSGSSISVTVALPGGLGADLTLSFEDVSGLSLASLGVSARLINPLDPVLLARLPGGVAPALPVMLRIEPPLTGPLTFTGIASLEIHTHNLLYTAGCPLRLFSAPVGGAFQDITVAMGPGSYRAVGNKGGFSEFLIVSDTRPVDPVITLKLDRLEGMLDDYTASIPGPLYDDLEARLDAVRAEFTQGDTLAAIAEVDGFLAVVEQHSGTEIPDVWRSARDLKNVAGYLRAEAGTLRFSLALKQAAGL